jgi:hypothetical protein
MITEKPTFCQIATAVIDSSAWVGVHQRYGQPQHHLQRHPVDHIEQRVDEGRPHGTARFLHVFPNGGVIVEAHPRTCPLEDIPLAEADVEGQQRRVPADQQEEGQADAEEGVGCYDLALA